MIVTAEGYAHAYPSAVTMRTMEGNLHSMVTAAVNKIVAINFYDKKVLVWCLRMLIIWTNFTV